MNKKLEISRSSLLYFLFLLPFIFFPIGSAPFELGRTFQYGALIGLMGIYFFFQIKENIKLPNKFILIFFSLNFITNLFSNNITNSIFGSYPRYSEGSLIDLIIILFLILIVNLSTNVDIMRIQFWSSIPVTLICIYQLFINNERISGTFGQPNFLGIFLSLTIFHQVLNWEEFNHKNKVINFIYLFTQLFILFKSASLTAILGLFGVLLYLLVSKKIVFKFKLSQIFIITLLITAILLSSGNIVLSKFKDIYFQLKDRNETTISDSLLIRFALWETTLSRVTSSSKNVILGNGANYFIYEFEKFRNPKLDRYSEYNLFFDKPHNYYLEIVFSYGFLSLLIFGYLIYKGIKKNNQNSYYLILIAIFIFFNWLDIYLKIIFFYLLSINLVKVEFNLGKKLILTTYVGIILISIFFLTGDYYFKKENYNLALKFNPFNNEYQSQYIIQNQISNGDFFYQTRNPKIQVEGLKYFTNKELENYKEFLLKEYPNNLPIKINIESRN